MTTTEYNDREALRQEIVELRQDYEEKKSRVNYLLGQLADTRKERDKYRDMASRRQGQFDRLKANFDEVVRQRDEYRVALRDAATRICESHIWVGDSGLGFKGPEDKSITPELIEVYLLREAQARQAGEEEEDET